MEPFTNSSIDTRSLPKFETVIFEPLQAAYRKVLLFNMAVSMLMLYGIFGIVFLINSEVQENYAREILLLIAVLIALITAFALWGFRKKGFAFRQHDLLFKSGIIATTTTIIPYNRVQHVALHQGLISGRLGLATIEIFTAGGSGSDIRIPGIQKDHAEQLKQLIMSKLIADRPVTAPETSEDLPLTPEEDAV